RSGESAIRRIEPAGHGRAPSDRGMTEAGRWQMDSAPWSPVLAAFLGSLAAGAATVLGALPLAVIRTIDARTQAGLMGFGAGVMLAASVFSLIVPALVVAEPAYGHVG